MSKIFISYQRQDSKAIAGRIFDQFEAKFGGDSVFMDIDIPPGDFHAWLTERLGEADIVLALIGHGWADARDETGHRRLDNPNDFVRTEIEAAISRKIELLPVMIDAGPYPRDEQLPDSIKPLMWRYPVRIDAGRDFNAHIAQLIEAVERHLHGIANTLNQRMCAVADAPTENFGELLRLAGLDPVRHLRFQEWSGSSFAGSSLKGCDFTGARLLGCDFTGALITGARFDQAILHQVDHRETEPRYLLDDDGSRLLDDDGSPLLADDGSPIWTADSTLVTADSTLVTVDGSSALRTNLRAAADWDAHVAGWRRPARLIGDAHLRVGTVFQDAPFAPELVVVPPGEFMMGSPGDDPDRSERERPQRLVMIREAFAVGRYAVTFDEWDFAQADKDWRKVTGLKPRKPDDEGWGRGNRPVIHVSWEDAQAYVRWLSAKTGRGYRLPREAEWEYVARAGTVTPFWWGGSITPAQANYDGIRVYEGGGKRGDYRGRTVPVDEFAPNPFGLYQVHGNVLEWVEDVWHGINAHDPPTDGSAWAIEDSGARVLRGGAWYLHPQYLRAASLIGYSADYRYSECGFRVSRTLNP